MLKKFFVFIYISFGICTLLSNKVFATENFTTNNLENICDETGISDILSKYADNEILQKITNVFNDELLEQDDEFSRNEKLKHLLFSPYSSMQMHQKYKFLILYLYQLSQPSSQHNR